MRIVKLVRFISAVFVIARHRGGVGRGLQIGRRDRHSEIDARVTFDSQCIEVRSVRSPCTTSAPSRRNASAR